MSSIPKKLIPPKKHNFNQFLTNFTSGKHPFSANLVAFWGLTSQNLFAILELRRAKSERPTKIFRNVTKC